MNQKSLKWVVLFSLVLFISAFNSRITLAAAVDEDLVFATVLSEISGVSANEIAKGNWKETSQLIYDRYTINHSSNIDQKTVDDLKLKYGYKFKDIIIAAQLASAFKSTPETILKLKPVAMDWNRYGGILQQYLFFRKVFRKMDENPRIINRSKEEILATELINDTSVASVLHNSGFSGEELLGIIILADMNGITKERLLSELGQANSANKQTLVNVLQVINEATGI